MKSNQQRTLVVVATVAGAAAQAITPLLLFRTGLLDAAKTITVLRRENANLSRVGLDAADMVGRLTATVTQLQQQLDALEATLEYALDGQAQDDFQAGMDDLKDDRVIGETDIRRLLLDAQQVNTG